MAAFTLLALSTNCYKLRNLLKSIQHAFMLCYQSKLLKEWEPNAATVFGTFVNLVIPGIGDLFCIWQSFQWIEVRRYYQSKPFRKSTCREAKHGNGLWHFCTIFGALTAKPVRPDDSLEILTEGQKRFFRNNVPDVGPLQQVFYMLFA